MAEHGAILEPARGQLVAELVRFATIARGLGARDIAFVGTQPLRQAVDAATVVVAVEAASGVPLHVLDHAEEGLLNLLGATAGRAVEHALAVVDIGGGSSEVVVVEPGARARAGALPIGGAVLTRDHVAHDPPTVGEIEALREAARTHLAGAPSGSPSVIIAVGGTSSNLVKVIPAAEHDRVLTTRRLAAARGTLISAPAAAIAERFGIRETRARILPAGAAILEALMAHYGATRVEAVEEGIREGVVLALARAGRAWRDRLDDLAHGWPG